MYDHFSDWSNEDDRRDEVLQALNDLCDEGFIFFDDDDRVYLGEFRGRKFFTFEQKNSLYESAEKTLDEALKRYGRSKSAKDKSRARYIREQIDKKGMIDVGAGVSHELNISKEKLDQALAILEAEGYPVYGGRVPQVTNPSQKTTIKVVCPPGTEHKDIYNYENIHSLNEYISRDGGDTYEKKFHYPESMDSKRLMIRYKEVTPRSIILLALVAPSANFILPFDVV